MTWFLVIWISEMTLWCRPNKLNTNLEYLYVNLTQCSGSKCMLWMLLVCGKLITRHTQQAAIRCLYSITRSDSEAGRVLLLNNFIHITAVQPVACFKPFNLKILMLRFPNNSSSSKLISDIHTTYRTGNTSYRHHAGSNIRLPWQWQQHRLCSQSVW